MTDAIDDAIANSSPEQTHLTYNVQTPRGKKIQVVFPIDGSSDDFETAIGMLIQLRAAILTRQEAEKSGGLVAVERGPLVHPDGKPLS